MHLPDGRRVLAIRAVHVGGPDEARRLLAPLFAAAGPPLVDGMRPMRFADAQMGGTAPKHLELLEELPRCRAPRWTPARWAAATRPCR